MGIENPDTYPDNYYYDTVRSPEQIETTLQHIREELQNRGLDRDAARNLLNSIDLSLEIHGAEKVQKAERYEETVWRKATYRAGAELILQLSNPQAVAEFNAHIDAFNADIDRIKRENDAAAVRRFLEDAVKILKKYNA
jgi:hypothetical protein